MLLVTHR